MIRPDLGPHRLDSQVFFLAWLYLQGYSFHRAVGREANIIHIGIMDWGLAPRLHYLVDGRGQAFSITLTAPGAREKEFRESCLEHPPSGGVRRGIVLPLGEHD